MTLSSLHGKRLVLIGTGWGGVSFLKALDATGLQSLTVISPRNYFLFTPLLPGVTTGTTEPRSIMDPIRHFIKAKERKFPSTKFEYLELEADNIDPASSSVLCSSEKFNLKKSVPYDLLVLAPGAKSNNFGTPGVDEHCLYLKEIPQARKIRTAIIDAFEKAALLIQTPPPSASPSAAPPGAAPAGAGVADAAARSALSFVIVGGGPTGVEFASELRDFLNEDLSKAYKDLAPLASVTVIQSAELILNMYDRQVSEFAEQNFARIDIRLLKNSTVVEVKKNEVLVEDRKTKQQLSVPFGVCVWAAGIAPRKITANIIKTLGPAQQGNRLIKTDAFMKVKGAENIFAIGDCSTIECPELVQNAEQLFEEADVNKDGTLTMEEIEQIMQKLKAKHPLLDVHAADEILDFQAASAPAGAAGGTAGTRNSMLDRNSWRAVLSILEKNFKSAPATAQVAQQEGEYVAALLAGKTSEPFSRVDRGMMSYVGAARAVMQTPVTGAIVGSVTFPLWRGAYASKLFSMRSRHLVVWDWIKKVIYGRDLSRM